LFQRQQEFVLLRRWMRNAPLRGGGKIKPS
jgi:hypothetical protein